jgi:hypothetical protein
VNRGRFGLLAVVALVATACGLSSPSGSPGTPGASAPSATPAPTLASTPEPTTHVLGLDWGKADVVDAPPGAANGSTTPYENPGSLGHPQHYQGGQADLLDVANTSQGLVAVGFLDRDVTADAWLSADGRTWARIVDFPAAAGSQAVAVTDGLHGIVAVGHEGTHAAIWRSADGRTWERAADGPALHADGQLQMTAVASSPRGYVAAGYLGSLVGPIEARFWRSADGRDWTLADEGADLAGSRVSAIAARSDGGFIAVGTTGDAKVADGSTAWTSTDGSRWTRTTSDALRAGLMRAVTAADAGFVAVGNDLASTRAMVFRSTDGRTWDVVPDAASLDNFGLKIEMRDVAWDGQRFIAGGHRLFGTQFPTGLLWLSSDGSTWERANESSALSQGRISGVAAGGPGFVAVGTYGSPDFAIPTVWLSPP